MTHQQTTSDHFFARYSDYVVKHPVIVLAVCLFVLVISALKIPQVTLDTSTEGYLHHDDPALIAYNKFRDEFGRDEIIVVGIGPANVFDIDFLDKLKTLHKTIEKELPYLDEVTSLVNARNTYGDKESLVVEELLDIWPTNDNGLGLFREKVISNPLYRNLIISPSNNFTTLLIKTSPHILRNQLHDDPLAGFDDGGETSNNTGTPTQKTGGQSKNHDNEIIQSLQQITGRYQSQRFPISIAGTPVMAESLKDLMKQDMRKFTASAVLLIVVTLFLMFRRISGVLLPLIVIVASVISTIGIMAWTGTPIKLPTQILPSFLLAVGVAATIHITSMFFRNFHEHSDKLRAIKYALQHTGLPIIMTGVTTAVGLFSFSMAEVAPVTDLGIFASTGVILSLLYTLALLPALLAVSPIGNRRKSNYKNRHLAMDRMLSKIAEFSIVNHRCIIGAAAVLLVSALLSLTQLYFYHNPLYWLPQNTDIRSATEKIDQAMHGSNTIEIVIDTQKPDGLYDPETARKINFIQESLDKHAIADVTAGKSVAITDIIKETHQALNENDKRFYTIPDDRKTIAQELLLFENSGSNDLEELTDNQFSKARLSVKIPWSDAGTNANFANHLEKTVVDLFGETAQITVTGMIALMGRTMDAAISSTETSYLIAFVIITLIMVFLLRNLRLGLLSMVPNLLPIIIILGFMAYQRIPLDMFTMLIGSIAIGIVVDDTIHILYVFKRNLKLHNNFSHAVTETLLTSGRAIFITSIVLACGFFIFSLSVLHNLQAFGLLTGLTILTALLADLFLLPAILTVIYKDKKAG